MISCLWFRSKSSEAQLIKIGKLPSLDVSPVYYDGESFLIIFYLLYSPPFREFPKHKGVCMRLVI